ncbi:MAG: TPM domain-containing protein, partial [Sphingomonadaceae bacterium]|nr:TPM domain-containing protein [Sphingomonadaceae bacterium]
MGRVVDAAHVLPPAMVADLTAKLAALETATGTQLVVATIPALGDEPIEDYGYRLGRAWGIGQKGRNTGAILIVAPNDRKVRIEVGYGLEPVLTDALTSVIIQEKILPAFKAGDLPGGIAVGTDALIAQLSAPPDAARATATQAQAEQPRRHRSVGPGAFVWLAIVVVWLAASALRRGGGYGGYGSRSSGIGSAILWGMASSMMERRGGSDWGGSGGGGFGGGDSDGGDGGGFSGGGG